MADMADPVPSLKRNRLSGFSELKATLDPVPKTPPKDILANLPHKTHPGVRAARSREKRTLLHRAAWPIPAASTPVVSRNNDNEMILTCPVEDEILDGVTCAAEWQDCVPCWLGNGCPEGCSPVKIF